jgi:trimeric autotransporter adhesin
LVTTTYSATCTFSTGCSSTITTTATVNAKPTYSTAPKVIPASCNGTVANSSAQINLTTLQNAERADISLGSSYTGPAYGAQSNKIVSGSAVTFTGLPNPSTRRAYTIRLFSAGGTCFTDVQVLLDSTNCQCQTASCVPATRRKIR